jgi:protein-disulfide isomerase
VAGVIVVLVLAVAVAVGLLVQKSHKEAAAAQSVPPVTSSAAGVPVAVDSLAGVVTVGQPGARNTLDVYEDPLCPVCGAFEKEFGGQMRTALTAGSLRLRYHLLNLLDDRSAPPGYSMRAASAALAVAAARPNAFMSFHDSLFADQPAEGSAGLTAKQLDALAAGFGVPSGTVTRVIQQHAYEGAIQGDLDAASRAPGLRQSADASSFGTPTVAQNGTRVEVDSPAWRAAVATGH